MPLRQSERVRLCDRGQTLLLLFLLTVSGGLRWLPLTITLTGNLISLTICVRLNLLPVNPFQTHAKCFFFFLYIPSGATLNVERKCCRLGVLTFGVLKRQFD